MKTQLTSEEYERQLSALKAEVAELKKKLTSDIKRKPYGLTWLDVPEAFEEKSESSIPILEEVKDKAIKNDDGKPTHILIEGDNYHALTCLNYTHKGKIDVIYIDPPYNTGSDGFTYKDKRFLKEYPDGTTVPKEHPLRHSVWLSFMSKRLRLAKNLLSDKGVIFISIDDNEQANLKLLCDEVFGEGNFIGNIIWEKKYSPQNDAKWFSDNHDFIICYAKNKNKWFPNQLPRTEEMNARYKNPDNDSRGSWKNSDCLVKTFSANYVYPVISPTGKEIYPPEGRCWMTSKENFQKLIDDNRIYFGKDGNGVPALKRFLTDVKQGVTPLTIWKYTDVGHNQDAMGEILNIFGNKKVFATPKPLKLINRIFQIATSSSSTILDFFAGSGTTLHATMKLNAEDGGRRQCILVQQNEGKNKICEEVTFERNRRVMQGYTNSKSEKVEGLGNSLKYYRTDFVGKHNPRGATDSDSIALSQKAGCLISLLENTLEEIATNDFYQIYSDGKRFTGIYFSGDAEKIPEFVQEIQNKKTKCTVYIFSWGNPEIFENEFDDMTNITLKAIPKPILEIYKSLNGDEK